MARKRADNGEGSEGSAVRRPVLDYPVVGLGASAGGIDALRKFFAAVPEKPGMAFVVVLHLHPEHESHLAELLRKVAKLPLHNVGEDTPLEPDNIYVITPRHALTLEGGVLRVNPAGESPRHPVDTLFRSMAEEQCEKAVAVVLSGTGSNGAAGVARVKEEGGAVFVQDPQTAEHASMPMASIASGIADGVLAPEAMPDAVLAYAAHAYVQAPDRAAELADSEEPQLNTILSLLRGRAKYDFHGYKSSTLVRRIRRRMGLRQIEELGDYAQVLRGDPEEVEALARDLLINVTSFFRDREAWEALEKEVIEPLIRDRSAEQPMRVWVPACSTGEEAYSLAMLLLDCADAADKPIDLKVFATDAAPHVLSRARAGRFAASAAEEMPPERLARYFEKQDDYYQASKRLRETIVFAPQKLLEDPPFSRMDVVSCRNLLIYLEPEAQKKLTALLHFSLREGGYLFLGTAETVGDHVDLFQTVSKKWRIYRRVGPTRHDIVHFPVGEPGRHLAEPPRPSLGAPGAAERARVALLDRFAPPSVPIDEHFRVHYFHGDTARFLRQPPGEPTQDLQRLAHESLLPRLRAAVHRAMRAGKSVVVDARVRQAEWAGTRLAVTPLRRAEGEPPRLLVSFLSADEGAAGDAASTGPASIASDDTESDLEEALRASQVELRDTVEQLESSNEELKASNEEITSMNEELQSTNEELETSKEEMQSLNEELNTVNVQLQSKVEELEQRTNDLDNLLSSSSIATLFLDREMRIRWSTEAVRELFEIMPADVGRPVVHLAQKFDDPHFIEDSQEVLRTLQPSAREVATAKDRWFERRTLPYRTEDNRIDGVVVTFTDVTDRKRREEEMAEAKAFAEKIVETVRHPLIVLDDALKVVTANPAFHETYDLSHDETIGRKVYDVGRGQWQLPELKRLLEEVLPDNDTFNDLVVEADFPDLGHRSMLLNARRLDHVQFILLAIEDVTERRRNQRRLEALLDELQHRVKNLFGNIRSLLSLSTRGARDIDTFVQTFSDRLSALERTQNILTMQEQEGGFDLRDIITAELEAHGAPPDGDVKVEGGRLPVARRTAQALGMVVHELATNGLKYGALAHGGQVHVAWETLEDGERRLRFRWRETGLPEDRAKEVEGGFGSRLIREAVPYMLGGTAELVFVGDGVCCTLEVPLGEEDEETVAYADGERT